MHTKYNDTKMSALADIVVDRITERGITISELARRVGMNVTSLNQFTNKNRGISALNLIAICMELDLSMDELSKVMEA